MHKSQDVILDLVEGSPPMEGSLPVVAEDVHPSSLDPILFPAPNSVVLPSFVGGLSSSLSPSEKSLMVDVVAPFFLSLVSSGSWQVEAAKVEDGWTVVKRKKSKPIAPPLEMNLKSCKGGFKSKNKS